MTRFRLTVSFLTRGAWKKALSSLALVALGVALGRSWEAATRQFPHYLEPIPVGEDPQGASAHPGQ